MLIERQSMITGKIHIQDLDVTDEQLDNYFVKGMLIQEAFPHLSADDREFLRAGITKEEWESIYGPDEE